MINFEFFDIFKYNIKLFFWILGVVIGELFLLLEILEFICGGIGGDVLDGMKRKFYFYNW